MINKALDNEIKSILYSQPARKPAYLQVPYGGKGKTRRVGPFSRLDEIYEYVSRRGMKPEDYKIVV